MYSAVRPVITLVASSFLLATLVGCADDGFGADLGTEASAVSNDAVGACPIPVLGDIPGHESVFYQCAETAANFGQGCGPDGYFVGYGTKYSQRFYHQARPRMSARGQKWIDDVLVCLQHDLRESIDATTSCSDVWTTAFDSHPSCYMRSGFCTLSPLDIAQVIFTIDTKDWLSRDAARQLVTTAKGCSAEYASWFGFFFGYLLQ